jgi:iron(III) transport system ATP-binding protein
MRLSLSPDAERVAPSSAPAQTALLLDDVCARYGGVVALQDVSFAVNKGEIACLLGPSGSGKSTLLRLVAGVDVPASGRVVLDGVEVAGPSRFVEPEHRRVGMVFQDYALFPHLTVADNVAFGLNGRPRSKAAPAVDAMLDRLGLRRFAASYPHMLSGGERQRVALARAMAPGPRVLLMDEPFSSLDSSLREQVRRYTVDFLRETGTTTVVVTHDPEEAMRIGDRIALLHAGRLLQYGPPDDIYSRPVSLSAARLLGDTNVLHGLCMHGRVETPLGRFAVPHLPDGTPATVCVRPEHLQLATHPASAHARVVSTTFLGETDLLDLALPGLETPVRLRAFGRTGLQSGDHVGIEVIAGHALILPHDSSEPVQAS